MLLKLIESKAGNKYHVNDYDLDHAILIDGDTWVVRGKSNPNYDSYYLRGERSIQYFYFWEKVKVDD